MKILAVLCSVTLLLVSSFALAHPHFNKSVSAKLPSGVEAVVAYNTTPANLSRASDAPTGVFVTPRRPSLSLSGSVSAGGTEIPAGEYTIGVIKNGDNDWTMALHKGKLGRGDQPDMANVIKLKSLFSSSAGSADHMLIDITPGKGQLEGKAVLTLHFGNLMLAGALS